MNKYLSNGWNWIHFTGAGLANWFLFFIIGFKLEQALLYAIIPTAIKELGDCIARLINSEFLYRIGFDPAGGDLKDVGMAAIGTFIAFLIIIIKGVL